jgi:hypothetical protein
MDLFDDLYKLIETPDVFDELLSKAMSYDHQDSGIKYTGARPQKKIKASAPASVNVNDDSTQVSTPDVKTEPSETKPAVAPSANTIPQNSKTKGPKLVVPKAPVQGTPLKADTHTSTVVDSSLVPVKQTVNTPEGVKQKTFHESSTINTPSVSGFNASASKAPQSTLQTSPFVPQAPWDAKAQYYHNNLRIGDTVGFHGYSDALKNWVPTQSKVVDLNPEGEKVIHVAPTHASTKDNPEAPPVPVHYSEVTHFKRPNPDDPNKKDHFEYDGEYDTPPNDVSDHKPDPHVVPTADEMMNEHTNMLEARKKKIDSAKKLVQPGDFIHYSVPDPETGKIVHLKGIVADDAGGKNNKNATGVNILNQNHELEQIPYHLVSRVGKKIGHRMIPFAFDTKNGRWDISDDNIKSKSSAVNESEPEMSEDEPKVQNDQQQEQGENNPIEEIKGDLTPFANTLKTAGANIEGVENGKVYFTIPNSDKTFKLPVGKVSPEAVDEIIKENTPKKEFGEDDHWVNKLQPNIVKKMSSALASVMQHEGQLPARIIAAKNRLLHPKNDKQYFESYAEISEFLKDPIGFKKDNPPKNVDYFKDEHKLDVNNPNSLNVADKKLTEDSPNISNPFFRNKQESAASQIFDIAKSNGLNDIASKISGVDPSKDNTELLHYYRNYLDNALSKDGKQPTKIDIPSVDQAHLFDNLDELSSKMEDSGLDHPYYTSVIDKLNHLIEKNPNSPSIDKLFGELNNYVHVNGKNDPREQIDTLKSELSSGNFGDIDPEDKEKIDSILSSNLDPQKQMDDAKKILNKYGEYEPDMVEGQNKDLEALNYLNGKLGQPNTPPSSSGKQGQEYYSNGLPKPSPSGGSSNNDTTYAPPGKKWITQFGMPKLVDDTGSVTQNKTSQISPQNSQHAQPKAPNKQSVLDNKRHEIERFSQALEGLANNPKELARHKKEQGNAVIGKYEDQIKEYNQLGEEHSKETGEHFTPMKSIFDQGGEEQDPHSKELHDRLSRQASDAHDSDASYMRTAVLGAQHTIDLHRRHFMQNLDQYNPDVKDDIKAIDGHIGGTIKNETWEPIPEKIATTQTGKRYIQEINNQINRVRNVQKITGISAGDLFKALQSDIESEKVIAKRDFGIAIKKSFGETNSREIASHFNVYLDDIVEITMTSFPNIPVKVRKSITRHFVKCINNDVIKNNSGIELSKSLKHIYSKNSIQAMTDKISLIADDIREVNKPIFYVDNNIEYRRD